MKGLQDIFQVLIKPGFLILFLFGFLGSDCGRVTGGSDPTPPNTEEVLAEQQAKADAAEQAAEEQRRKTEEARLAGDAAKVAEEERKQREAEAEAEKQRKIQTALQTAAPAVNRAHKAVERVDAAKEQVEGTSFASERPFPDLEREAKKARAEAFKAYDAVHAAKEASAAVAKAEEVSLAANKADQQAQIAENFVSHFQSQFTFNADEKALFPSSSGNTDDFESQCQNFIVSLAQSLPDGLRPPGGILLVSSLPDCQAKPQAGPPGPTSYNCFCKYNVFDGKIFYKK